MKLLLALSCALLTVASARSDCLSYEAFAHEGRVVSLRALTLADVPDSPRIDGGAVALALADRPMVLVEVELEARRRVAVCEDLARCTPSARAWRKARGLSRFLAFGTPSDWEGRIDRPAAFFAPTACCDVRPTPRPSCALALPVILPTPDDLLSFVHEERNRPATITAGPPSPSPADDPAPADRTEQVAAGGEDAFTRARELYERGPAHADEIIELLRPGLEADPGDEPARGLLALTLFGSLRFEEALVELDTLIAAADERGVVRPRLQLLKARALEALGREAPARETLEAFRSWFQLDEDLASQADDLAARLAMRSPSTEASDRAFLQAALQALPESAGPPGVESLGILIRSPEFPRLQHDADLAPAINSALLHGDEVIVLFAQRASRRAVFFRDGKPRAFSADGGAHREPVSEPGAFRGQDLTLSLSTITADDGTPLAAYEIHRGD